jgi:hypothetical protein
MVWTICKVRWMFVMWLYRHEIMLMVTARINVEYTGNIFRQSQLYASHIQRFSYIWVDS